MGRLLMAWKIHPEELRRVPLLPVRERYEYFVKHVADWEEIWSLKNVDGWVMLGSDKEQEHVPVWPHPEYARMVAVGSWADCAPEVISLDNWLERWIPGMIRDQRLVAVFPDE